MNKDFLWNLKGVEGILLVDIFLHQETLEVTNVQNYSTITLFYLLNNKLSLTMKTYGTFYQRVK